MRDKYKYVFGEILEKKLLQKIGRNWIQPTILGLISFFAFGIFIAQQGFHWDDWGFVWLIRTLGTPGLFDYFATNRPFLAYLYSITTNLFGTNPVAWQVFSLFLRWMTAITLLWVLRILWPEHQRETFFITVFFLIYPGFNQQAVAITYSHFFLAQSLLFTSIGLMLKFSHEPGRLWWAGLLSVFLSAFNLFSTEYFFGLELLRPIFLWVGLRDCWQGWKPRLKHAILVYTPFFLALLGYLYWRYFILGFYLYQPELVRDLKSSSLAINTKILPILGQQWYVAFWQAWKQITVIPDFVEYGPRLSVIYIAVLLLTGIGIYNFVRQHLNTNNNVRQFQVFWLGIGILSMLLAGIPFMVTDLPVRLTFPNSRFTLPFALGTAFLLVAFLSLIPRWRYRILLASVISMLAVGVQFNNSFLWREDWQLQKSFFWQMAWRIPDLRSGSILLSSDSPIKYSSDNSLTFPLNWIYAAENQTKIIDHAYFFVSVRLGSELSAIKTGLPIHQDYLAATFDSSSNNIVVVHFSPPGCFRVLHPIYDQNLPLAPSTGAIANNWLDASVPVMPRTVADTLELSNLEQVASITKNDRVLPSIFGIEPKHTWCYYFEKADLARQENNWEEIVEIGDQVFRIPYSPDDLSEYLPFIEAYARTGHWIEARDLSRKTANAMPILRPALCAIWQRLENDTAPKISSDQIEKMKEELGYCPYP